VGQRLWRVVEALLEHDANILNGDFGESACFGGDVGGFDLLRNAVLLADSVNLSNDQQAVRLAGLEFVQHHFGDGNLDAIGDDEDFTGRSKLGLHAHVVHENFDDVTSGLDHDLLDEL
jgi:hypothetical protein